MEIGMGERTGATCKMTRKTQTQQHRQQEQRNADRMMLHGRNGDAQMMLDGQGLGSHVCSPTHKNQYLDSDL